MAVEKITINDVGPRDGLQNQPKILSVDERIALVNALVSAGLPEIEVGAFVSPKAVPAMAGTGDVFQQVNKGKTLFSALIPNQKGFQIAEQTGLKLTSLVIAASNTMNQKNIRMSTQATMEMCQAVIQGARESGSDTRIQAYLATAWECPFEGKVAPDAVLSLAEQLMELGVESLVIADTVGAANPGAVKQLMTSLAQEHGTDRLSCHFHDTRAMGLANVYAAVEAGIRRFDASIAGLGGCPFAPGASGNVATEDVVLLAEQLGFATGIDMPALLQASDLAIGLTGTAKGGKAKTWLEKNYQRAQLG